MDTLEKEECSRLLYSDVVQIQEVRREQMHRWTTPGSSRPEETPRPITVVVVVAAAAVVVVVVIEAIQIFFCSKCRKAKKEKI